MKLQTADLRLIRNYNVQSKSSSKAPSSNRDHHLHLGLLEPDGHVEKNTENHDDRNQDADPVSGRRSADLVVEDVIAREQAFGWRVRRRKHAEAAGGVACRRLPAGEGLARKIAKDR